MTQCYKTIPKENRGDFITIETIDECKQVFTFAEDDMLIYRENTSQLIKAYGDGQCKEEISENYDPVV